MQLNAYQRAIMQIIFDTDQALEQQYMVTHPQPCAVPKSVRRWMPYRTSDGDDSPLKTAFRHADLVNHGLLLILESLKARGLIAIRYERALLGESVPCIKLTSSGRQRVRCWMDADVSGAVG